MTNTGGETWNPNGTYLWKLSDPTGGAGPTASAGLAGEWDFIQMGAGTLDLTNLGPGNTFNINISRIGANGSNVVPTGTVFAIAQAAGLTGASLGDLSSDFVINDAGGQSWLVTAVADPNNGALTDIELTAQTPEPASLSVLATASLGLLAVPATPLRLESKGDRGLRCVAPNSSLDPVGYRRDGGARLSRPPGPRAARFGNRHAVVCRHRLLDKISQLGIAYLCAPAGFRRAF